MIDCDAHILEPATLWEEYLEERYRDRAIRIEEVGGKERLIIGNQIVLEGAVAGLGGAEADKSALFSGRLSYRRDNPEDSFEGHARLRRMNEWGISKSVIFPTICILPFPTDDQDLANAYCRAYNNWIYDFCEADRKRLFPIAVVNWRDVAEATREFERCIQRGFRGLFVPPEMIDGRRPADPRFNSLWALCQAARVPACFHVIVRFDGSASPFGAWHATSPGPIFSFGLGGTGQLMPAIASTITDQLFERFPTLKVVSVEAGCGFAPYLMDRLDAKFEALRALTGLSRKPSEHIRSNCYFVAEQGERMIDSALELVGRSNIVWGSDYPHIDALRVDDHLPKQWPELSSNAEQLFRI
ncbi:MAG: amidohydrolase family protein [Pseudomonadales bacterium]